MSRWRKLFRSSNAESLPTADVTRFEPLARKRLSRMAYDYVRSGGADEISMRENRAGFGRLKLSPSVLVDVSQIDTRVNLFGGEFESPILLAPVPIIGCTMLKVKLARRAAPARRARDL